MLIIDAAKCAYNESNKMFRIDASRTSIDLFNFPNKIEVDGHETSKLTFYMVNNEPGKRALYHAFWLPLGKHHGLIPMKQYYLIVE